MFVGVLALAFGVIVMVWPDQTLVVLSVLLGIQLLLAGVFRLISAFSAEATAPGLLGFVGILGMVAGVAVLRHPFETVAVLATILGIVWIVSGTIDVISAIADSRLDDRWLAGLAGLLSVAFGIVVVSWPGPTVRVIAWIAGIYLVVVGLTTIYGAYRLRSIAG
jgi:uncharacterized membrane protein HdeD (DUF308 family)